MVRLRFLLVCLFVATCLGHPSFRDKIPNGREVPHPCIEGAIWEGVGHENKGGAGTRNEFGRDFKLNGLVWNKTICGMDSDGDSKTNGEELGDPDCEWTPGSSPNYTTGLSHPGICEPFGSNLCDGKPSFVDCQNTSLQKCKALNEPETFNYTIRFPETAVPAKENSYMCITFDFPMDKDYHIVAFDPLTTNHEIMHNTMVFSCERSEEAPGPLMQPKECSGEMFVCPSIIAVSTAGGDGECVDENMGFLVGTRGFKYAVMRQHWNNPQLKEGQVDSSGMVFHLTPKLRPNNAGVLMIGQSSLDIPPGTYLYSASGSCPGDCTEQVMDGPVNISLILNQMHLIGRAQYTEMIREGMSTPLAIDNVYDYNSPITHAYSSPVQLYPGDELKTTCMFSATSRNVTTNFGEAAFDEVCLAFITYYPKENIRSWECVAWKSLSQCEVRNKTIIRGCDLAKNAGFGESQTITTSINSLCSPGFCRQECLNYVRELKKQPCFTGEVGSFLREMVLQLSTSMQTIEWFSRIDSCDSILAVEKCTGAGATYRPTQILMTLLVVLVLLF